MTKSNIPTTSRTSGHESSTCKRIFFFLDISEPVSCGWCWKPFIWVEACSAQRHNATEHRVNMKCAPPSVAFRGSLFDIFYPKSSQRPGRNELCGCRVKGLSAAIRESKVFWDGSFSLYRCSSCHRDGETFLTFFHCRSDSAKKKKIMCKM